MILWFYINCQWLLCEPCQMGLSRCCQDRIERNIPLLYAIKPQSGITSPPLFAFNWEAHWQNEHFSYRYHCKDGISCTDFSHTSLLLGSLPQVFRKTVASLVWEHIASHESGLCLAITVQTCWWSHGSLYHECSGWRVLYKAPQESHLKKKKKPEH